MLCTSGFANDVMFSHNRVNGQESNMPRVFRPVRQVAAPVGRPSTLFGPVR